MRQRAQRSRRLAAVPTGDWLGESSISASDEGFASIPEIVRIGCRNPVPRPRQR